MLAYVFWHWPKPTVDRDAYVQKLRLFHESLATNRPEGFSHSLVVEMPGPPWLNAGSFAFEDWYLVNDSAALDKLNFAAVSGRNEKPHNTVATEAAGGIAGLYRLKQGDLDSLPRSNFANWFAKPATVPYPDLYSKLSSISEQPGVGLWCRQMTLGPTTEFCFRSENELTVPPGLVDEVYAIPIKTVWSGTTSQV